MSALTDRIAQILTQECHEGVTRKGEFQPCDRPAVATRHEVEFGTWYPVCTRHTRGLCRPLHRDTLLRVVSAVLALKAEYGTPRYVSSTDIETTIKEALNG